MTKVKEIWKDVNGFDGRYRISNSGIVINVSRNKVVRPGKWKGYPRIKLFKDNIRYYFAMHRLIAEHFIPNKEQKPQINHKNGIKTDNRVENLEWCTAKENTQHAWRTGLAKPCSNPNKKLNDKEVMTIKKRVLLGETMRSIGLDFGVSDSLVLKIKFGYRCGHIPCH